MLEEFEDTKLKSAKRSRPDPSVGADTAAKNGLRTSPFSFCVTKKRMRRRSGVFVSTSLECFSAEEVLLLQTSTASYPGRRYLTLPLTMSMWTSRAANSRSSL